jgi:uncharacterized RDD family membrane protein YckC
MAGIITTVIATRPAGFWIRVLAALLDFGLFALVKLSLGVLAARVWRIEPDGALGLEGTITVCMLLFVALYVVVLHALEGQTVGKLIVGVRVVGFDGEPPALGASVLRFLAYAASVLPFGLGFVMAGLRSDRRALHDLIAGTRVERLAPPARPTAPASEPEQLLAPP